MTPARTAVVFTCFGIIAVSAILYAAGPTRPSGIDWRQDVKKPETPLDVKKPVYAKINTVLCSMTTVARAYDDGLRERNAEKGFRRVLELFYKPPHGCIRLDERTRLDLGKNPPADEAMRMVNGYRDIYFVLNTSLEN